MDELTLAFFGGFDRGMWLCLWLVGFLSAVICTLGAFFVGVGVTSFCVNKIREVGVRKQFDASSVGFVSSDNSTD